MKRKRNKAEPPPEAPKSWRFLIPHMVAGVLFIAGATFFAQRTDVAPKLQLDFQGVRTEGRASLLPGGGYRLSYTHPSGTIYSRSWKGNFGIQRLNRSSEVEVAYSSTRPETFQPATVSYVPGLSVVVLTIAGMSCILYVNRRIRRMRSDKQAPDKG